MVSNISTVSELIPLRNTTNIEPPKSLKTQWQSVSQVPAFNIGYWATLYHALNFAQAWGQWHLEGCIRYCLVFWSWWHRSSAPFWGFWQYHWGTLTYPYITPCPLQPSELCRLQPEPPRLGPPLLHSSGMLSLTWAGWLWLQCFACCTWSLHFRYSVRAAGSWALGWYRVARVWEISQAYEVFRGGSYRFCGCKTRLTQEPRPKV